ncbi:hypothetical protein KO516_21520 [Citreicella sp. C3M06]|uniref:hypothetical protein n=1 Tax=Citreicella sp. C3M06 TaxID=2841564 RepID=UPI001C0A20E5|nr:hypothetical protein [Citreicella sp. C3M06]MBU2963356.1 hypothetical protein [Citreicella sp. C3M06]
MLIPTKFAGLAQTLCTPDLTTAAPAAVQSAWLDAKAARGQPLSARQVARLDAMPSTYPGRTVIPEAPFVHVITEGDPDPLPPAPALNAIDAARIGALPRTRAAIARMFGGDAA